MERPILMSGWSMRGIVDGRKTQTRRTQGTKPHGLKAVNAAPQEWELVTFAPGRPEGARAKGTFRNVRTEQYASCTADFGVGDVARCRETQRVIAVRHGQIRVRYEADGAESDWIEYPSRLKHVPTVGKCLPYGGFRESSRARLPITAIRCERLGSISLPDCLNEGVTLDDLGVVPRGASGWPRLAYRAIWESINGAGSWDRNPWLWVYEWKDGEIDTRDSGT